MPDPVSPFGPPHVPGSSPAKEAPVATVPLMANSPAPDPACPPSAPVPWYRSLKFKAYVGGWLTLVFGWFVDNVSTHQFDIHQWTWIALTVSTVTLCGAIVKDWMNPGVDAPFDVMNKSNFVSAK